jgi:hypothetical protein
MRRCPVCYANLPMSIQFCACLQKLFCCEFHECWCNNVTFLRDLKELLFLLSAFIFSLGEIQPKRAAYNDVELLWVSWKLSRRNCTYMYVIWKVEITLVWSTPFTTLLYLSKMSKNSHPLHPNEMHLFRRLDSPWCLHILKSFESGLHFRAYQKWAGLRSIMWHGWLVFTTQRLAMKHLTTMVEWALSRSIRSTDFFTTHV